MTDTPRIATALPGPNAQAIIARDKTVVSPSYTRGYPLVMARGEGAIVEDVDGNRFLDLNAGIAVTATGQAPSGWPDSAGHAAQAAGETCGRCGDAITGGQAVRRRASGDWVHETCREHEVCGAPGTRPLQRR